MPTCTQKRNTKNSYRSRIAAQNLMEGDTFIMRGEPNLSVWHIKRNEKKGIIVVSLSDETYRTFDWNDKVSIVETPDRNRFRRNSLRRYGYPNYMDYSASR
jgi:hypothetical protein